MRLDVLSGATARCLVQHASLALHVAGCGQAMCAAAAVGGGWCCCCVFVFFLFKHLCYPSSCVQASLHLSTPYLSALVAPPFFSLLCSHVYSVALYICSMKTH